MNSRTLGAFAFASALALAARWRANMRDRRVLIPLVAVLFFGCHSSYAAADSISLSSSFVDFGSVPVGTTSSAQSVIVTLSLDTNHIFSSFSEGGVNAPFHSALASSPCSSSNLSCTYNLTFAPTAPVASVDLESFAFFSFDQNIDLSSLFREVLLIGTGVGNVAVPGPIVGAGLPGLILAGGVLLALARRRQRIA
jgi:hypothetical protein